MSNATNTYTNLCYSQYYTYWTSLPTVCEPTYINKSRALKFFAGDEHAGKQATAGYWHDHSVCFRKLHNYLHSYCAHAGHHQRVVGTAKCSKYVFSIYVCLSHSGVDLD